MEIDKIEAGPEPKEAEVKIQEELGGVAPDIQTYLPVKPVTFTGVLGRLLGIVPTVMAVPGETTSPPSPDIIETSSHQKQK